MLIPLEIHSSVNVTLGSNHITLDHIVLIYLLLSLSFRIVVVGKEYISAEQEECEVNFETSLRQK